MSPLWSLGHKLILQVWLLPTPSASHLALANAPPGPCRGSSGVWPCRSPIGSGLLKCSFSQSKHCRQNSPHQRAWSAPAHPTFLAHRPGVQALLCWGPLGSHSQKGKEITHLWAFPRTEDKGLESEGCMGLPQGSKQQGFQTRV